MPILDCCKNPSTWLITYQTGRQYYVCKKCADYDFWTRGILSKKKLPYTLEQMNSEKN